MNTKHLSLLVAAGGLLFGPRHLLAEDPPSPPPAEAPKPPPRSEDGPDNKPKPDGDRRESERGRRHHEGDHSGPERRGPEMKATPFIGVMTRSLSPEVRAQTGLAEGFGLLVEDVLPESPATTAGLKQHDVLVLLGDQRLVNMEQLAVLVRNSPKDIEIVFTIKRAGAEQKVTVKVGEKMMPAMPFEGPSRWPGGRSFGGGFDGERFGHDLGQGIDRFQQGMREFQERMQDWAKGPKDRPAPQPPQFDREHGQGNAPRQEGNHHGPRNAQPKGQDGRPEGENGPGRPPGEGTDAPPPALPQGNGTAAPSKTSTQSTSTATVDGAGNTVTSTTQSSSTNFERNVTRRDRSGEYSLRQEGSEKVFTAKPVDGQEQTFTVTTEDQRKTVPEAFKEKLQQLDEVSRQVKPSATDEAPSSTQQTGARTTTI